MRNLIEYPITDQEICKALKEMAAEQSQLEAARGSCGDMRSLILSTAADLIGTRSIATVSWEEFTAKMPVLEAKMAKLQAVADAAAGLITDDREWGEEVIIKMGGHRRIKLADTLKALKADV